MDVDLRPRLGDHAGRGRGIDRGEVVGGKIGHGRLLSISRQIIIPAFLRHPRVGEVLAPSLRAKRSNPSFGKGSMDCFVASAQNCFAILSRAPLRKRFAFVAGYDVAQTASAGTKQLMMMLPR